jgi:hypothetical protein
MAEPTPRNIVHVSAQNLIDGRTKHVTANEITEIADVVAKFGNVSFSGDVILSAATATGSFLQFTVSGVTYAFPLYTP